MIKQVQVYRVAEGRSCVVCGNCGMLGGLGEAGFGLEIGVSLNSRREGNILRENRMGKGVMLGERVDSGASQQMSLEKWED